MKAVIKATYYPIKIPQYCGNPMIEAIPPLMSEGEYLSHIENSLDLPECLDDYDENDRLELAQLISYSHTPNPASYSIYKKLHRTIKKGYLSRNPEDQAYNRSLYASIDECVEYRNYDSTVTPSIGVIGITRTGKSTEVRKCLKQFPQVILHNAETRVYRGVQVLWLSIDCPDTKTAKGFLLFLLFKLDELILTNYFDDYIKNKSISVMALRAAVIEILKSHNVGLIHIDELQNIKLYEGTDACSFAFIDSFFNQLGIPVIWSSIPTIFRTLESSLTTQCRLFSDRSFFFTRMKADDENWITFIDSLYFPSLCPHPMQWDDQVRDTIHELTCGLPGLVTKFMSAFYELAIEADYSDDSFNTLDHLMGVYVTQFSPLHTALDAVRRGDDELYEDTLHSSMDEIPEMDIESISTKSKVDKNPQDMPAELIEYDNEEAESAPPAKPGKLPETTVATVNSPKRNSKRKAVRNEINVANLLSVSSDELLANLERIANECG